MIIPSRSSIPPFAARPISTLSSSSGPDALRRSRDTGWAENRLQKAGRFGSVESADFVKNDMRTIFGISPYFQYIRQHLANENKTCTLAPAWRRLGFSIPL